MEAGPAGIRLARFCYVLFPRLIERQAVQWRRSYRAAVPPQPDRRAGQVRADQVHDDVVRAEQS